MSTGNEDRSRKEAPKRHKTLRAVQSEFPTPPRHYHPRLAKRDDNMFECKKEIRLRPRQSQLAIAGTAGKTTRIVLLIAHRFIVGGSQTWLTMRGDRRVENRQVPHIEETKRYQS